MYEIGVYKILAVAYAVMVPVAVPKLTTLMHFKNSLYKHITPYKKG